MVNSGPYTGRTAREGLAAIVADLEAAGRGGRRSRTGSATG